MKSSVETSVQDKDAPSIMYVFIILVTVTLNLAQCNMLGFLCCSQNMKIFIGVILNFLSVITVLNIR